MSNPTQRPFVPGSAGEAIRFRPAGPEDIPFLQEVYASSREEELAVVPWTAEQKRLFLESQSRLQEQHYRRQFPNAEYQIILHQGEAAGRFYISREPGHFQLLDITLLPQFRSLGLGSAILGNLLAEAREKGVTVGLYVLQNNRAEKLYQRLGFRRAGENGFYHRMEWRAEGESQPVSEGADRAEEPSGTDGV